MHSDSCGCCEVYFITIDEFPGFAWLLVYQTNCQTTHVYIYDRADCGGTGSARWPPQWAPPQDVDVEVVDGLASIWSVIDDNPVALRQTRLLSTFPCNYQQVAQQLKDTEFSGCENA